MQLCTDKQCNLVALAIRMLSARTADVYPFPICHT